MALMLPLMLGLLLLVVVVILLQMFCCWWLCGCRDYRRCADAGVEADAAGGVVDSAAEVLTLTLMC
jgi:hypothetical protein